MTIKTVFHLMCDGCRVVYPEWFDEIAASVIERARSHGWEIDRDGHDFCVDCSLKNRNGK